MAWIVKSCVSFPACRNYYPVLSTFRYAVFPPSYAEPIRSKREIMELEVEGKTKELKVVPFKPAVADVTNSVFDDPTLKKFTNMTMKWGNKVLARQLIEETFTKIKRIQLGKYHSAPEDERDDIILNPLEVFHQAYENCKPVMTLTNIKKGGITYKVPMPITEKKSSFMAMKWLIMACRGKKGAVKFTDLMSRELIEASQNKGKVITRKNELHKQCELNKAYAHYRWS